MEKRPNRIDSLLEAFGLLGGALVEPFGNGLINRTWKITAPAGTYILQRVNERIFAQPEAIAYNVRLLQQYLTAEQPDYFLVGPLESRTGEELVRMGEEGVYRLFPFVTSSHTIDVPETPEEAFEAARQFGRFTRALAGFDATQLKITLPHFHDLGLRYTQFTAAVRHGVKARVQEAQPLINELLGKSHLVNDYQRRRTDPAFQLRVTHHDTKISNVLFDKEGHGLCVIDLDTVMPGYFFSDVGDMLRTYVSPASEEERDCSRVVVRDEFVRAIADGYFCEMGNILSKEERSAFFFAGQFLVYMQALRFLTDYLNNDVYYGSAYEAQNLNRARNQATLLKRLEEKEALMHL